MKIRTALSAMLPWLMFLRYVAAGQEYPVLLFNNTLMIGTSQPELAASANPSCFPALGFKMPATLPSSLDGWWCDSDTEYAFMGFSYEITQCALDLPHLLVHHPLSSSSQAKARAS